MWNLGKEHFKQRQKELPRSEGRSPLVIFRESQEGGVAEREE